MKSKFGKCGLPGGRLRLSAPPSRTRHPLPDRRRNPHRYVRPLDVIRSGRRLVRERTGCGLRSSRGPAEPVHSRHDLEARSSISTRKTRRSRRRNDTRSTSTCRLPLRQLRSSQTWFSLSPGWRNSHAGRSRQWYLGYLADRSHRSAADSQRTLHYLLSPQAT